MTSKKGGNAKQAGPTPTYGNCESGGISPLHGSHLRNIGTHPYSELHSPKH